MIISCFLYADRFFSFVLCNIGSGTGEEWTYCERNVTALRTRFEFHFALLRNAYIGLSNWPLILIYLYYCVRVFYYIYIAMKHFNTIQLDHYKRMYADCLLYFNWDVWKIAKLLAQKIVQICHSTLKTKDKRHSSEKFNNFACHTYYKHKTHTFMNEIFFFYHKLDIHKYRTYNIKTSVASVYKIIFFLVILDRIVFILLIYVYKCT